MSSELEEHLETDKKKVYNAVKLQAPIEVTSYILPKNMEAYLRAILKLFLEACHQEQLEEYLNFCLGELLTNSKRANTKRVYFKEQNLDINDISDYNVGMETFKDVTFSNVDYYLELQKKEGLYVKLSLQLKGENIIIEIRNNSVLTSFEEERIKHKFELAQQYHNMDDVVANVLDQSEGAGLGIIIIILMLQTIGVTKDNFKIYSTDEETVTQIVLPCNNKLSAGVDIISYEFVNLQSKMVVLKSHFEKVNKIVQMGKINKKILLENLRKDLQLSIVILKYALEKDPSCFSLPKALDVLTNEELKFIFSDSNPKLDIIDDNPVVEEILAHAYNTGLYAYNLYKNSKNKPEVDEEFVFLLGMFNSLDDLLIETANKEQKDYVKELSNQYDGMSDKIQDLFNLGYAGNYLKLVYAKKLGLSDEVANVLNHWNNIEKAEDSEKSLIRILYVAEMLQCYSEEKIDFYQIYADILAQFNITSEEQFKYVLKKVKVIR